MVKFTTEQLRKLMDETDRIRSLAVIAHVDHGKSTLTDSLIQKAGIISADAAGNRRFLMPGEMEKERGITIKSTGVSLVVKYSDNGQLSMPDEAGDAEESDGAAAQAANIETHTDFLINLIDSPGHVDFSSEVTAALRITDGALVVVDCIEGVCVQTETVLRQAMAEKVVPALMVNKLDRAFLELQMDGESAYQALRKSVESVNAVIAPFEAEDPALDRKAGRIGYLQVDPAKGNVAFGSGLHLWGFTLKRFAQMYASKFGVAIPDMMTKLWGDHFLDAENKKWRIGTPDECLKLGLKRSFVQFCLDPIAQMFDAIMNGKTKKLEKMLQTIGVTLKKEDQAATGKALLKKVMSKWLPCADALLEMIVMHLPSPAVAQKYRCAVLYDGPLDDAAAQAIMACDKNGPLMMYVSKMIPMKEAAGGRFYAFGRVFSGTVRSNQKVRILGAHYQPGSKRDLHERAIQRTLVMMGPSEEKVEDVPCGNNVLLVGVDEYLIKTGTITTLEEAHCFKTMKYSVSPVVRVAVDVKNPADMPKLIEGLKRLAKSDPLVQCETEESGEHIIAGAGELHLDICLSELANNFMAGAALKVSEPIVAYRETVRTESSQTCLAKTANGLNRFFCSASPMADGVAQAIDEGSITAADDVKARARKMTDEFGMDLQEVRKIWAFGPDGIGPNIFLDASRGVQYLPEVRDSVAGGFQWAMKEGPLTEEPCRGVVVKLLDASLHPDSVHRSGQQVEPAVRRACFSSMLTAEVALMEPYYIVDVTTQSRESVGAIYNIIAQRRGQIIAETQQPGSPFISLKCYLPIAESFGLASTLRAASGGKASAQCSFDHWGVTNTAGDPTVEGTKANELAMKIRTRKGLEGKIRPLSEWLDKL